MNALSVRLIKSKERQITMDNNETLSDYIVCYNTIERIPLPDGTLSEVKFKNTYCTIARSEQGAKEKLFTLLRGSENQEVVAMNKEHLYYITKGVRKVVKIGQATVTSF